MRPSFSAANAINRLFVDAVLGGDLVAIYGAIANGFHVAPGQFCAWIAFTFRIHHQADADRVACIASWSHVLKVCKRIVGLVAVDVIHDVTRRRLPEKRSSNQLVNEVAALPSVAAHHDNHVTLHDALWLADSDHSRVRGCALDSTEVRDEVSIAEFRQWHRTPLFAVKRFAFWLRLCWQMRPRSPRAYVGDCGDRDSVSSGQRGLRIQARSDRDDIRFSEFGFVVLRSGFATSHPPILPEEQAA